MKNTIPLAGMQLATAIQVYCMKSKAIVLERGVYLTNCNLESKIVTASFCLWNKVHLLAYMENTIPLTGMQLATAIQVYRMTSKAIVLEGASISLIAILNQKMSLPVFVCGIRFICRHIWRTRFPCL